MYRGRQIRNVKLDTKKNSLEPSLNRNGPYIPSKEEYYEYEEKERPHFSVNHQNQENITPNKTEVPPKKKSFDSFVNSLQLTPKQRHRLENKNMFLYLRIPELASLNSVYELRVCNFNEVNRKDFYTISMKGVCRFAGKFSEFTEMEKWEKDYRLFFKIRLIKFFDKFRLFKQFYRWRQTIRKSKIEFAKKQLQKNLFFLNPDLGKSLIELKQMCEELNNESLYRTKNAKPQSLEGFCNSQEEHEITVSAVLTAFNEKTLNITKRTCEKALEDYLTANGISLKESMSYMEKAFLQAKCRKLKRYIKLIDTLTSLKFYTLGLKSVAEFAEYVNPTLKVATEIFYNIESGRLPGGKYCPLFLMEASFVESSDVCEFNPSLETILNNVCKVLDSGMLLLKKRTSLLVSEELVSFLEDIGYGSSEDLSAPEVFDLVTKDPLFVAYLEDMTSGLEDSFEGCEEYGEVFTPFRSIFLENLQSYEKNVQESRHTDISQLEATIQKFKSQEDKFKDIPLVAIVDMFEIHSESLKNRLLPSPMLCLDAVKVLIPSIMNIDLTELTDNLNAIIKKVREVPIYVKDFTQKCLYVDEIQAQQSSFVDKVERVNQLKDLLSKYSWPISEEVELKLTVNANTMSALQDSISQFESGKVEDTQKFIHQLKENIPNIKMQLQSIRKAIDDEKFIQSSSRVDLIMPILAVNEERIIRLREEVTNLNKDEEFLNMESTDFPVLQDITTDFKLKDDMWKALQLFKQNVVSWSSIVYSELSADELEKQVKATKNVAMKASKGIPNNEVAKLLLRDVENIGQTIPLVSSLTAESLKERHWIEINEIAGFDLQTADSLTFGELIDKGLTESSLEIQKIAVASAQERVLEDLIKKVEGDWAQVVFEVNMYKEQKDIFILGSLEDILSVLDDSFVTVSTILGSRYLAGVKELVNVWKNRLLYIQETIDEWITCQRNWIYLESIFSAPDIQRQLPGESKKFFAVDTFFKMLLKKTYENPNVLKACTSDSSLKITLVKYNEDLETIQKSLEDYLETKRMAFPRFYFLSNDELLEILSQTKDVQCVQPHLRKCFDALVGLDFGPDRKSINIFAMLSPENERVELTKNLKARGNVEDWLTNVEQSMRVNLQKLMKTGTIDYAKKERKSWVKQHAGQVIATVAQIYWAMYSEKAIKENALKIWFEENLNHLQDLIDLIRSNLTKTERMIVVALVTTDVHARDIIETLMLENISDINNFTWQMQLRYYFNSETNLVDVKHSDALIDYGYEYEGCTSRLVITPLTDRCWLTITGALNLKLGAAPAGPAGTGKTESSKDLAKALGVQCIVFNCSDQIDYKMMGKLFMGLAQTGSWTCLDEFNRIDIEVLSVVAQQLLLLRQGRLSELEEGKERKLHFMGSLIKLLDHHVIVTMNPGYAGRTELPDNLKVCFRPVAMMVPDYALIAEIMLFAEGFGDAKTLSRKMIKLFHLSSQQLSQQPHYDYGLRAVKSVLVMAGGLKRSNPGVSEEITLIRALQDSNVPKCLKADLPLFHAIVKDLFPNVTIPENDYGDFELAIKEEINKENLEPIPNFIKKVIQQFDIFNIRFGATIVGPTLSGKTKCYEILKAAMVNMKNRNSGDDRYQNAVITVLNPKCISMGELYGEYNEITQEWQDGLASTIMRGAMNDVTLEHAKIKAIKTGQKVTQNESDKTGVIEVSESNMFVNRRWIVFDGPIDALWIENMNTVLDDNMTLCLANGERIKLVPEMKCLFEVNDLEVASPATVSRLGVMYMSPEDMDIFSVFKTFFKKFEQNLFSEKQIKLPSFCIKHLSKRFQEFMPELVTFQKLTCKEPVSTTKNMLVISFCKIFSSIFSERNGVRMLEGCTQKTKQTLLDLPDYLEKTHVDINTFVSLSEEELYKAIDKLFAFSLTWSVGSTCYFEDWEKFDAKFRSLNEDISSPLELPLSGMVFDSFVNCFTKSGSEWISFDNIVESFDYSPTIPYFSLFVSNINSTRYQYFVKRLLEIQEGVFMTGASGNGKTGLINKIMSSLVAVEEKSSRPHFQQVLDPNIRKDDKCFETIFLNFSAQTSSAVTQITIESKLEKKRKNLLGAPSNKLVAIFVDDINMPLVEEYGAQQPIELLRFLLDRKGLYDREKLFYKNIIDSIFLVAGAPPGGGRHKVTPRFKRHFNIVNHVPADKDTLFTIFKSILHGYVSTFKNEELLNVVPNITKSVVKSYARLKEELLPTPQRFHYLFNLRDVSKVFQGILQISSKRCPSINVFVDLCTHECQRIFEDRLISIEDKEIFRDILKQSLSQEFKGKVEVSAISKENFPICFTRFSKPTISVKDRLYECVADEDKLRTALEEFLDDYNLNTSTSMHLIFFRQAIQHVSIVARILQQKRGNAFLIGVGGSGKRSVTRLASYINEMEFFQIEVVRNYGINEFHEDIKNVMVRCGVGGKKVTFLFTDSQVIHESFVEDVNNILNSGEIANLFLPEEYDKIYNDLTPFCQQEGIPETRENLRQLFLSRVRNNLKMVLCMSPVGEILRVRCRNFPALINSCTIDWFMTWPKEALEMVAFKFLKSSPTLAKFEFVDETLIKSLVELCGLVHTSVLDLSDDYYIATKRRVYTTPKSYLDLISLYLSMLQTKRAEVKGLQKKMETGVQKLLDTNLVVDNLKEELKKLQPVLVAKNIEATELIAKVEVEKADAQIVEKRVAADEEAVQDQKEKVKVIQEDAQKDLDAALPALNNAVKALDSLDKKDITEMKSFAKPPPAVQMVMEAICIFFNMPPSWDSSKKLLSDQNFMKNLQEFDKDNIQQKVLKKVKKLLKEDNMQMEVVKKVSKAATSLCLWVHAMNIYSDVAKTVEPKRKLLKELNEELDNANSMLLVKQTELNAVREKVADLEHTLNTTLKAKQDLEDQSQLTKGRLERAAKLTSGLYEEGERWKDTLTKTADRISLLVGNTFVSAACISYNGSFTGVFRKRLVDLWIERCVLLKIPITETFLLSEIIGNEALIREWQIGGLPTDSVSVDSALMVYNAERWPLLIDPQLQANKWIRNIEKYNNIEVVKAQDPSCLRALETCIRNGASLLVEDVLETVDPAFDPILRKEVFNQGGRSLIRLGDSNVDYDPGFRLFLCSKLPNPHYLPEICIKVTLINFTVTEAGLTDQLLGNVVKIESPDVESKKNTLVKTLADDSKQLKELEDKVLKLLSESEGNVLDDTVLIATLGNSKVTSTAINKRLVEAEKTRVDIDRARSNYSSIASFGSLIYFVVADLSELDTMYQFSLSFFCNLFTDCLKNTPENYNYRKSSEYHSLSELDKRLIDLKDYMLLQIFLVISRGLFEQHKVVFASLLCLRLLVAKEKVSSEELNCFLRGKSDRKPEEIVFDCPETIENNLWEKVYGLTTLHTCSSNPYLKMIEDMYKHPSIWVEYLALKKPHEAPLPNNFQSVCSDFQKLLLLKIFREELLVFNLSKVVEKELGRDFIEFSGVNMEDVFNSMYFDTPCIFVLSAGADPTDMLLRFAKVKGYDSRLSIISLGQGQGPKAEALIETSKRTGDWVLLQNCHLAKSWMPSLENLVVQLETDKDKAEFDSSFRLFLTSLPAPYFPITILQNGIKLTNEPPKGIRANMVRTFETLVEESNWETCQLSEVWKKLCISLSFFHAIVQERRKYGPLGWNIRYEFNDTDLESSLAVLRRFLDTLEDTGKAPVNCVPWDALRYVTGEINYGGRVTDDWDRRCLMTILDIFSSPNVLVKDYRYSSSEDYKPLHNASFQRISKYMKALPLTDSPVIFGMHHNAEILFQIFESKSLVADLLQTSSSSSSSKGAVSSDEIVANASLEVLNKLPKILNEAEAGDKTFVRLSTGLLSSLDTVLMQEIDKFNRLLTTMSQSILDLNKAIKGIVVMSMELDKTYYSILNNAVPDMWTNVGFASRKPLNSWIGDVVERVAFLRKWLVEGKPKSFPLNAFFFPQGFMTGILQTHARKYEVPVDVLSFNFKALKCDKNQIVDEPNDGVYVYGLHLEGASFNVEKSLLEDAKPGKMLSPLPPIHMWPEIQHKPVAEKYLCPVYKTSERRGVLSTTGMSTNFVVGMELETEKDPKSWILTGCASLLNLDE